MKEKAGPVARKMSKSSSQHVNKTVKGEPALGKNIGDASEKEVKKAVAKKMSTSSKVR